MTDPKPKTDAVLIKEFFEMSASDTIKAIKELSADDKAQLGAGLRDGTLTY